jgi:hypothetical protein
MIRIGDPCGCRFALNQPRPAVWVDQSIRRVAWCLIPLVRAACARATICVRIATAGKPSNERAIHEKDLLINKTLGAAVILGVAVDRSSSFAHCAGRRRRQILVQQMPGLPCHWRERQEQGRSGAQRVERPQIRYRRRVIPIRTPTRIPASPGMKRPSRNISRTPRPRSPAPRWPSPASRRKPR